MIWTRRTSASSPAILPWALLAVLLISFSLMHLVWLFALASLTGEAAIAGLLHRAGDGNSVSTPTPADHWFAIGLLGAGVALTAMAGPDARRSRAAYLVCALLGLGISLGAYIIQAWASPATLGSPAFNAFTANTFAPSVQPFRPYEVELADPIVKPPVETGPWSRLDEPVERDGYVYWFRHQQHGYLATSGDFHTFPAERFIMQWNARSRDRPGALELAASLKPFRYAVATPEGDFLLIFDPWLRVVATREDYPLPRLPAGLEEQARCSLELRSGWQSFPLSKDGRRPIWTALYPAC